MQDLAGKVAVITGGASGIGLALAQRLAAERVKLALLDVEAPALAAAERALRDAGADVVAVQTDVGSAASIEAAAGRVRERFGLAHIIVNNAGVSGGTGPLWTLTERDWKWTLDVNLWGVVHGIRTWVPPLLASGEEGHVINTASIAGLTSHAWMGPYTATKHAVVAISEVLSKELELADAKIDVSVLCPGFVKTGIARSDRNRPSDGGATTERPSAGLAAAMTALVDNGRPAEAIADAVVDAIRTRRFYILTHDDLKPAIEHRQRDILDGRRPGIDPMFRALLGGKRV
jgi:NAD(P)-dependent dehydrogenase (short-subunit alcohol dehydrogenase family)